jgi:hypothetical protein
MGYFPDEQREIKNSTTLQIINAIEICGAKLIRSKSFQSANRKSYYSDREISS